MSTSFCFSSKHSSPNILIPPYLKQKGVVIGELGGIRRHIIASILGCLGFKETKAMMECAYVASFVLFTQRVEDYNNLITLGLVPKLGDKVCLRKFFGLLSGFSVENQWVHFSSLCYGDHRSVRFSLLPHHQTHLHKAMFGNRYTFLDDTLIMHMVGPYSCLSST